jgi:MerR HTH family regulatory protein
LIEPEGLVEVPDSEVEVGEAFRPDRHNPILIRIGRAAARKALAGRFPLTLATLKVHALRHARPMPRRVEIGVDSKVYPDRMTLTVSKLADRVGLTADTIRYYEREGLLPPPDRSASGYRAFGDDAVERLRFIKGAQRIGLESRGVRRRLIVRTSLPRSARRRGCPKSPRAPAPAATSYHP